METYGGQLQTLAIAAVGFLCLLIGIALSTTGIFAYLLYRAASEMKEDAEGFARFHRDVCNLVSVELAKLGGQVEAGLTKLDATSLREASVSIQRTAKNLASTTAMLYKLVLSQEGAGAVIEDTLASDLDPETGLPFVDDALPQAKAFVDQLRAAQRQAASQAQAGMKPLPDIEDGWIQDEAEFGVGNG
jgi:hypothetical protein